MAEGGVVCAFAHETVAIPDMKSGQQWVGVTYTFDTSNGNKLWNVTSFLGMRSPVLLEGTVYAGLTNQFCALNPDTGVQKWAYNVGHGLLCDPVVSNGVVYVGAVDQSSVCSVYAFKASNGMKIWQYDLDIIGNYVSPLTIVNGVLFFSGTGGNVYAINASDGNIIWNNNLGLTAVMTPPLVSDGTVYAGTLVKVYALTIETGRILWSYHVGATTVQQPVSSNNTLFVNSLGKDIYAFDKASGDKIWSFTPITQPTIPSCLVVFDGKLYFNSRDTLYALSVADGTQVWSHNAGADIVSFSLIKGVVYYNADNSLCALDFVNGNTLWTYTTSNKQSPFAIIDNVVYLGAGNDFYALDLPRTLTRSNSGTPIIITPSNSDTPIDTSTTLIVVTVVVVVVALLFTIVLRTRKRIRGKSMV